MGEIVLKPLDDSAENNVPNFAPNLKAVSDSQELNISSNEFEISGAPFPLLVCNLNNGDKIITQRDLLAWRTPEMTFDKEGTSPLNNYGSNFFKACLDIKIRPLYREQYVCSGGRGQIALKTTWPGNILQINMTPGRILYAAPLTFVASKGDIELEECNEYVGSGKVF